MHTGTRGRCQGAESIAFREVEFVEADARCQTHAIFILVGDCSELARSHNPHDLIDTSFGGISRHKPNWFAVT
jgi:hypothetical protein